MRTRSLTVGSLMLLGILTASCRTIPANYALLVSGMAQPNAAALRSFIVLPSNPGIDTFDLGFLEVRRYMSFALQSRGYSPAGPGEVPQMAVYVGYGMGEPNTRTYTYSVPVFGVIPGSTTTVSGSATGPAGTTTYTGTSSTMPSFGVVGQSERTESEVTCLRHLVIRAVDIPFYRQTTFLRDLWKTVVVSAGSSCDLRAVLPALVLAAQPYLGQDTRQGVNVSIPVDDPRITRLRELRTP